MTTKTKTPKPAPAVSGHASSSCIYTTDELIARMGYDPEWLARAEAKGLLVIRVNKDGPGIIDGADLIPFSKAHPNLLSE